MSNLTRAESKVLNYALNYGMSERRLISLYSRPPGNVQCIECFKSLPGDCYKCAGTNRKPIPMEEVINCR